MSLDHLHWGSLKGGLTLSMSGLLCTFWQNSDVINLRLFSLLWLVKVFVIFNFTDFKF